MKSLEEILEEIREHSKNGNRHELTVALRHMMNNRRDYYKESIDGQYMDEYTDALYKILLLELDNEEEESIETAELAYLGICMIMKDDNNVRPEHYKRRVLLMHYFSDYFTDAIIEVFLKKYKEENRLQARSLAIECLEKMQLSDIFYLEKREPDFINKDEQLTDASNRIATDPNLSTEEQENAALLHKVMYAYLMSKYKN